MMMMMMMIIIIMTIIIGKMLLEGPSLRWKDNFFNWYSRGWSPVESNRHCGHQWPNVAAPHDYDDGEIGGMMTGR
jgi:hypothetical protein